MNEGPTLCSDCQHVRINYKSDPPWRWYCFKHPRLAGFGFVTATMMVKPPYLYCHDVNGGACPLFEAGPNNLPQTDDVEDVK